MEVDKQLKFKSHQRMQVEFISNNVDVMTHDFLSSVALALWTFVFMRSSYSGGSYAGATLSLLTYTAQHKFSKNKIWNAFKHFISANCYIGEQCACTIFIYLLKAITVSSNNVFKELFKFYFAQRRLRGGWSCAQCATGFSKLQCYYFWRVQPAVSERLTNVQNQHSTYLYSLNSIVTTPS